MIKLLNMKKNSQILISNSYLLTTLLKEIITEVSIDQLKTQFVDAGKISSEDFTEIIDATGNKSAYATWLVKKVADETIKSEDISKYKKYFSIFDRNKKSYPYSDINQYKTTNDISQFIKTSVEIANKETKDPSQQKGVARSDKYKEFYMGSVDGLMYMNYQKVVKIYMVFHANWAQAQNGVLLLVKPNPILIDIYHQVLFLYLSNLEVTRNINFHTKEDNLWIKMILQ